MGRFLLNELSLKSRDIFRKLRKLTGDILFTTAEGVVIFGLFGKISRNFKLGSFNKKRPCIAQIGQIYSTLCVVFR